VSPAEDSNNLNIFLLIQWETLLNGFAHIGTFLLQDTQGEPFAVRQVKGNPGGQEGAQIQVTGGVRHRNATAVEEMDGCLEVLQMVRRRICSTGHLCLIKAMVLEVGGQ